MVALRTASETNAATLTTSASGAGTFNATVLSQVHAAEIYETDGYVLKITGISGQSVSFQVKQTSTAGGALVNPSAAVSFAPGAVTLLELGT